MQNLGGPVVTGVFTLLGVAGGALLHFLFSRRAANAANVLEMETSSYCDFVRGVAEIAIARSRGDAQAAKRASALILDAKARMIIYGEERVLRHLAGFWRCGASFGSDSARQHFWSMLQSMRRASRRSARAIPAADIELLVWEPEGRKP